MAGKRVHAPCAEQEYCSVPDNPIGKAPMCNANAETSRVAKPGQLVTCQPCLNLLWDRPQWLHYLMAKGYVFPDGRKPQRKPRAKKQDPRQLDFADYLEGKN